MEFEHKAQMERKQKDFEIGLGLKDKIIEDLKKVKIVVYLLY